MSFTIKHGTYTELYTRQDVASLLSALELSSVRTGFDHGWLEALCRVGVACGIRYDAPVLPQAPRMIEGPDGAP